MNKIKRKLRSRSGASMLLAMVFMLFALFVGGTVLAAAAANGYRVEHMSDQQDYLDQRSAALLIADELTVDNGTDLRLTIIDIQKTIQPVQVLDGGVTADTGTATQTHTITIKAPTGLVMTGMQRVVVESTIWKYLQDIGVTDLSMVTLSGFEFNDGTTITSPASFLQQYTLSTTEPFKVKGTFNITGSGAATIAGYEAYFTCGADASDSYDFVVTFDNAQMTVSMDASYGTKNPVTSSTTTSYSGSPTGYARITTTSTQTAFSWDDPIISKGGA